MTFQILIFFIKMVNQVLYMDYILTIIICKMNLMIMGGDVLIDLFKLLYLGIGKILNKFL